MSGPNDRRPDHDEDVVPEALREAWNELPKREPPDLIDQAVLNRARAAVDTPHSSRPWSFGWPHALTTAAVIVLAVTLIMPTREVAPPGAQDRAEEPLPEARTPARSANETGESQGLSRLRSAPPPPARAEAAREAAREAPAEAAAMADHADAIMESSAEARVEPDLEIDDETGVEAGVETDVEADVKARLQSIRDLLAAGDQEAAREAALAFQRDYPDRELPDDLASLVPSAPDQPRP